MTTRPMLVLAIAALLGGCALPDASTRSNEVTVLLTDAPVDEATGLVVAFGRVDLVSSSGGGLVSVAGEVGEIDVMALANGRVEAIGLADVPHGTYHQVRLIVERATLAFDDEAFDVFVPSGAQSGLKIAVEPPLVVEGGEAGIVLVHFDVHKAIVETPPGSGSYILKPTALRAFSAAGGIEGSVVTATAEAGDPTGALANVRVDVLPAGGGEVVTTTYTESDGSFAVIALLEGTYDLTFDLEGYGTAFVSDVQVTPSSRRSVGVVALAPTAVD